jgi:hypothetical protein
MRGYSKWWHRMLLLFFTFSPFHLFTSTAQEMHIVEFKKLKKGPLNMNQVVTSKQEAILDLKTSEKGFSFKADGKQDIATPYLLKIEIAVGTQIVVIHPAVSPDRHFDMDGITAGGIDGVVALLLQIIVGRYGGDK